MNHRRITTERQFKSATGYSKSEFESLYEIFEQVYEQEKGQSYEEYHEENVYELPKLKNLEDCLFFVLFQLKNDLLYDSLGAVFQMSGSTAHENYKKYLKVLEQALRKKSVSEEAL